MSDIDFDEIWIGGEKLGELLEDTPCEIELDEFGVSGAQMNYSCRFDKAVDLVAALQVHPVYDFLTRKKAKITREEGLMARVNIQFEGISDNGGDNENRKTYALEGSGSTEPIESHKDFETHAGKWDDRSTWKNGAKFVDDPKAEDKGRFIGFVPTPGGQNKKAGVRSFLAGGVVYTETTAYSYESLQTVQVNLAKLCKIDDPPSSPLLPNINSPANWLLFTVNAETVGKGMKLTRKWRASGPNGWDEDWYGSGS